MDDRHDELRLLFAEILEGSSCINNSYFGKVYIKHFNNLDSARIEIDRAFYFRQAVEAGLSTIEEKEKELIASGEWLIEKKQKISDLKSLVNNLIISKKKLVNPHIIDQVDKQIKQAEEQLFNLEKERQELLVHTAENHANKKINEVYVLKSLFSDNELKRPLFNTEEFDELEEIKLNSLTVEIERFNQKFDTKALKRIALLPNFLNLFFLTEENCFNFYGKPIVYLSFFQVEIFKHGRFFKHIIQESASDIPQELFEDPDALTEWYETRQKMNKTLDEKEKKVNLGASSIVGCKKEDYQKMGIEVASTAKINEMAQKHGGSLTMEQMMKLGVFK